MTSRNSGISIVFGIVTAVIVFMLVQAGFPGPHYSSAIPLIPPNQKYAAINLPSFNITSMSSTYYVKIHVEAKPTWNVSKQVYLRIGSVRAFGEDGRVTVPPGPYDVVVIPGLITLDPDSDVEFNVSFIPWADATDLYSYADVTFIWSFGCYSEGFPSNGVALGDSYIIARKGTGGEQPLPS